MKSARLANYIVTLRKELLQLARACGQPHPALVPPDRLDLVDGFSTRWAREVFGYDDDWGCPPRANEPRFGRSWNRAARRRTAPAGA